MRGDRPILYTILSLSISVGQGSLDYCDSDTGNSVPTDARKLRYYHISEGSRIFYAIKPIIRRRVPRLPQAPPPPGSAYFTKLKTLLLKHFSEEDVDKIVSTTKEVKCKPHSQAARNVSPYLYCLYIPVSIAMPACSDSLSLVPRPSPNICDLKRSGRRPGNKGTIHHLFLQPINVAIASVSCYSLQELKRSVDKANLDVVEHIAAESLRIHEANRASLPEASTSGSVDENSAGP